MGRIGITVFVRLSTLLSKVSLKDFVEHLWGHYLVYKDLLNDLYSSPRIRFFCVCISHWYFRFSWIIFNVSLSTVCRCREWERVLMSRKGNSYFVITIWRSKHDIIIKSTKNRQMYPWTNWPHWLWRWRERLWSKVRIHPPVIRSGLSRTPIREKRRNLTQSCDKSPYTNRKFQKAKWQYKNAT